MKTSSTPRSSGPLFIFLMLFFAVALGFVAAQAKNPDSVSGFYFQGQNKPVFISAETHKSYHLHAANPEVQSQLNKLGNRDVIHGLGHFSTDHDLILESIDFVGLQKLLGSWSGHRYLFNFKNFAQVSLYTNLPGKGNGELKYAVTPAEGAQWKVFFTDSNQVTLASLNLTADVATLTFFDNQTGETKNSLVLTKIPRK